MVKLPTVKTWLELIDQDYEQFEKDCYNEFNKDPEQSYVYHSEIDVDQFDLQEHIDQIEQIDFCINPVNQQLDEYGSEHKLNNTLLGQHYFAIDSEICQQINKQFDLEYSGVQINVQLPGNITPTHFDRNRTFFKKKIPSSRSELLTTKNIKKYVIFLEDQKIGQVFVTGNHTVKWKKGTVIEMPWYMPHATANCSSEKRSLLLVPGIVNI